jgi:hypothetical protein
MTSLDPASDSRRCTRGNGEHAAFAPAGGRDVRARRRHVVVGSSAAGREVHDELDRIRRGERPAEDDVRRRWDQVTADARSRWDTLRAQIQERRHKKRHEG